jgi:DNA repair protein RecN (Recombination protein N)
MLELLHIENVAVIEKADIEFGGGLNVMTGETGAGKSIVIDALYAVTGGRASKELVRTGAKTAVITAAFSCPEGAAWLTENDLEPDESGQIVATRKITAEGKSTCRINGTPVTASQLRELGNICWIFTARTTAATHDEASHLRYLDGYARIRTRQRRMGRPTGTTGRSVPSSRPCPWTRAKRPGA